jgi:hypothetical protein
MKQNSEIILHGLVVRREVSEKGGTSVYTCNGFTKQSRGALAVEELEKWVLTIKESKGIVW